MANNPALQDLYSGDLNLPVKKHRQNRYNPRRGELKNSKTAKNLFTNYSPGPFWHEKCI
jgi:hypothetical protein